MSQPATAVALLIESQPDSCDNCEEAVISWCYQDGQPRVISRYKDPCWIGAKKGGLANSTEGARRIDFRLLPEHLRENAKAILYAALRHPYVINKPISFATLLKRWAVVRRYLLQVSEKWAGDPSLAPTEVVKAFMLDFTAQSNHIETVVGLVATLQEIQRCRAMGYLAFGIELPRSRKNASSSARALWREVHKSDFDPKGGHQPFDDLDATAIVRSALFYVQTLAEPICTATEACRAIEQEFPSRRTSRSEEGLCYRAQQRALARIEWPGVDAGYLNWPPKSSKPLRSHLRMLSAACAIVVLFSTGCRRSELTDLREGCLSGNGDERTIEIRYHKGEDDLDGRLVDIPACDEVVEAIEVQRRIRALLMTEEDEANRVAVAHDHLFVRVGDRRDDDFVDEDRGSTSVEDIRARPEPSRKLSALDAEHPGDGAEKEGGAGTPATEMAINGFLRDFKKYVVPEIDGSLSPHRFRKTVARLVTLTMEGAPLILQEIFGQTTYTTTVKYMFSSPFIQDEIAESFPELVVRNLRSLFQSKDDLGGGGAASVVAALDSFREERAASLAGHETGMTEDEFVELGLEMVKGGHMMLTVLAQGVYCLKPPDAVGPCADGVQDTSLPNIGRCTPGCKHHIQLGSRRPTVERAIVWLQGKLAMSLSGSMRSFYERQMLEYSQIFEPARVGRA